MKTVKEWYKNLGKRIAAPDVAANPTNVKVGAQQIKDMKKRKQDQLDAINKEMGWDKKKP